MLFNSVEFLLVFLPLVLGFWLIAERRGAMMAGLVGLTLASLFFYAWWQPVLLLLLCASLGFNYLLGHYINDQQGQAGKVPVTAGIFVNLGLLGFFKYSGFVVVNLSWLSGRDLPFPEIILPLAISFFTFQQIAWLVDCHRGLVREKSLVHYTLFISFFPQLIAGPIVHHEETIPQFGKQRHPDQVWQDLAAGLGMTAIGLFKKVIVAEQLALWADPVFTRAPLAESVSLFEAWIGMLCFTFQIYFDFSGYTDIALGLALMFGIRLPMNFDSPYKAGNISDFWRRWHMTLSRFLRDYVYIPLGGNRYGRSRVLVNVVIVMLVGGLWHGAGWTFVVWGGLHGVYLAVYHSLSPILPKRVPVFMRAGSVLLTMFFVMIAWLFFRAPDIATAWTLVLGVLGQGGLVAPEHYQFLPVAGDILRLAGAEFETLPNYAGGYQVVYLAVLAWWVWFLPNSQQIFARYNPVLDLPVRDSNGGDRTGILQWRNWPVLAIMPAGIYVWVILTLLQGNAGEFIYFQF